ncbi:hypothetical protein HDU97_000548 [Phlyctochytrium planicorne]|nr:hypothetical protein HDU97_000548 [Phlyctochytrium planicorne]
MDSSTLKIIEDAVEKLYHPNPAQDGRNAERTLAYHFPTFSESTLGLVSNASPTVPMTPLDSITNCQFVLERSDNQYALMFAIAQMKSLVVNHFSFLMLEQKLELSHRINLPGYVSSGIATLFCIVTKLGWYDADEFQNVMNDLNAFLQLSLAVLRQFTSKPMQFENGVFDLNSLLIPYEGSREEKLVDCNVQLIKNCLSFDFIGKKDFIGVD